MTNGFFEASKTASTGPVSSTIPKCGACGLFNDCKSPKMPVTGQGKKKVLIVGEAPGETEDEKNEQFVGTSGKLLRMSLKKIGVDLDRDCWKTNTLICRPPDNRKPTEKEIEYCRPNLRNTIKELDPDSIILLGGSAVRALIEPLWKEASKGITRWVGWRIPSQDYNAWICPTYHPSFVKRMEEKYEGPVVKVIFQEHLKRAFELKGKPWNPVPDYESEVEIELNPERAASWLRHVRKKGDPIGFDYETNMLKPDREEAAIVSCAVCWQGKRTLAYPWTGSAVEETSKLLKSDCPKIGANRKFEDRWTYKILKHWVKNWVWDCMISAHHLDNRKGITSVKFQAFVKLGLAPWNEHIRPYLEANAANQENNIRALDLESLLLYNGLDALVEFRLAQIQKKEMLDAV